MQHQAEMQIYKEILDKFRQLMAMEASEEESGVEGTPFKSAAPEMVEELSEAMGEDEDKAEDAEMEALGESAGKDSLKDEMKAFFGGGKPLMPGKKGMKVGVTEIAVMPGKKKLKY
jgi:hypothetical protein